MQVGGVVISFGMSVGAILFDFDGVLVDTEWAIYEAWLATFREHGQDLPLEMYTKCIGSDFATWSPKSYLEELTGKEFEWGRMDEERQEMILRELEEEGPMPGVLELLGGLKERGIPLAVVSSSSHSWVDGWLEKLEMRAFFTEVICRGDAERIKPAPDLYLAAAEAMGEEPGCCLVIEDSLNGLIAGNAAGMRVWVVPNRVTADLDFSAADEVFANLDAVGERLR